MCAILPYKDNGDNINIATLFTNKILNDIEIVVSYKKVNFIFFYHLTTGPPSTPPLPPQFTPIDHFPTYTLTTQTL